MTEGRGGLDASKLRAAVDRHPWVAKVVILDEVDSTNDGLRRLAAEGAPEGTVLVADRQTAGRGRRGRSWHSPPGCGLYLSALFRNPGPMHALTRWTLLTAVAAVDAVRSATGIDVRIKWPNDLWHDGKKLAGILVESRSTGGRVEELIAGVGINVSNGAAELPASSDPAPTSLLAIAGRAPSRESLALELLGRLGHEAATLRQGDWPGLVSRWEARASPSRGERVVVRPPDGAPPWIAEIDGLEPDGALRVRRAGGRMEAIRTSDSVRPLEG